MRVAVCIASYQSDEYLQELLADLDKQTFTDFKVYTVKEVSPCGKAKHEVIKQALADKPDYIQTIDADDRVLPEFLEAGVTRLDKGDIDFTITWGNLFGDRTGYIHSQIPTFADLVNNNNKIHSWGMFKRQVFEAHNFNQDLDSGVDWEHWLQVIRSGFKGATVERELYLKRWHDSSITKTVTKDINTLRQEVVGSIKKYRFHLLGLVHLPVSDQYTACAFTQKIYKLSEMLVDAGHEVFLYGAEGSNAPCTRFIQTHTLRDIRRYWGEGDNRFEIGYDWQTKGFKHDFNSEKTGATKKYISNAITEINRVKRPDDFLLVMQGVYQREVADRVSLFLTCEPGIGYRGSFAKYRAFESAYLQNFTYGSENPRECVNGRYYDRVIPNYFKAENFKYQANKDDYLLYVGRIIKRKGVRTAILTAQATGKRLLLAGQDYGEIDLYKLPSNVEYVGYADKAKRLELMGGARAVFVPTEYLEAFGGVAVEAQLCGTPVITTNFGVFPETVIQGVTGFRCNTLQDFVEAVGNVGKLQPEIIRANAEKYLTTNVIKEYNRWFTDLYRVYLSTLNANIKAWSFYHYD